MSTVPVEDYMRNLRAAIGAHRITRAELDALVTAGPTICAVHGLPVALGATVNGRPACAECGRAAGAARKGRYSSLGDLQRIFPREGSRAAFFCAWGLCRARHATDTQSVKQQRAHAAYWRGQARRHAAYEKAVSHE